MRTLTGLSLLVCLNVYANPLAPTEHVYIASEHSSVNVSSEEARLNEVFTFNYSPEAWGSERESHPILIKIPVWFPESGSDDPSVEAFWKVFQKDGLNQVTAANVDVFSKAVGMRVSIGDQPLGVASFYAFTYGNTNAWAPLYWQQPGYSCLVFLLNELPPAFVQDKTPVTISYRLPLLNVDGQKRFFYLPNFKNLPKNKSTADFNKYSVQLSASQDCSLNISHGQRQLTVDPGKAVVLSPKTEQAIRAVIKRPGIPEAHSPRDFTR
ncbi:MAG: hypothetical protein JWQ71_610 [Pedosphaera sp.]|nr:hypothetical protein [Pedosphaera sp.]